MKTFPTDFADNPEIIESGLDGQAKITLTELSERGFVVAIGLDRKMLPAIQRMAAQDHIRDYCPRDLTEDRFVSDESTAHWLSKGRAFFVLARKLENGELHPVGYGWSGPGESSEIPGGETTWAVRLGKEAIGQKLSEPFSRVIVEAVAQLYGAKNIWLETWDSNAAGVHTYGKLGFELVTKKPDKRLTANGTLVDDVRVYMRLPAE